MLTRLWGRTSMTAGVRQLAETNDAWWLVTDIGAYATEIAQVWQYWTLTVADGVGKLVCEGDGEPVFSLDGIVTNLPDAWNANIYVVKWVGYTTLMLPSEVGTILLPSKY